jgi:hypothetical protein
MRAIIRCLVLVAIISASTAATAESSAIVFSSTGVQIANAIDGLDPVSIEIGEQITLVQAIDHLSDYNVRLAKYDCEGLALLINAGKDGSVCIYFNTDDHVAGAISWDEAATDINGSAFGEPINAIDSGREWECDLGMEITCASNSIEGLSYIAYYNEATCAFDRRDTEYGFVAALPDCVTLGGFSIWEQ